MPFPPTTKSQPPISEAEIIYNGPYRDLDMESGQMKYVKVPMSSVQLYQKIEGEIVEK
jgi:hypothetical protein